MLSMRLPDETKEAGAGERRSDSIEREVDPGDAGRQRQGDPDYPTALTRINFPLALRNSLIYAIPAAPRHTIPDLGDMARPIRVGRANATNIRIPIEGADTCLMAEGA
jgi:hypothetical protein